MTGSHTLRRTTNPFRYSDSSPEVIRLAVMMYVKCPLFLRNVVNLLHERGIDICYETARHEIGRLTDNGQIGPSPPLSSGRLGRFRPRLMGAGPELAKAWAGDQMGLQVEGVVDGGMAGEEALG